jgi:hypothetical protein
MHISPSEWKYTFISSALDYNVITTQVYRLHIFKRDYKKGTVLTPNMIRILNRWMGEGHTRRGDERLRSSPDSVIFRRKEPELMTKMAVPLAHFSSDKCVARHLLTVNSCIKVRLDLQADKSPVIIKGPFFPRVVNPRYRIRGTMCYARIQCSKARKAILWKSKLHLIY